MSSRLCCVCGFYNNKDEIFNCVWGLFNGTFFLLIFHKCYIVNMKALVCLCHDHDSHYAIVSDLKWTIA